LNLDVDADQWFTGPPIGFLGRVACAFKLLGAVTRNMDRRVGGAVGMHQNGRGDRKSILQ
jgi:hypothetical protein